jgi:dTMP kinase
VPGQLVVFEGPEGAGKSTQIARLAARLEQGGETVLVVREPGGTRIGDEIRRLLLDPESEITAWAEALLFMASRAELVERRIRPALDAGATVIADRFFLSTYAYQVGGRGLPEQEIRDANRAATGGLVPGLTLFLSITAGEGLARAALRGRADRMEGSDPEFHGRVERAFETFAHPEWQRDHPECGPIVMIDAQGPEDAVHERVMSAVTHWRQVTRG